MTSVFHEDYVNTGMTAEEILKQEAMSMIVRAMLYIKARRPYEYGTIELLQDRVDAFHGERAARTVN